MILTQIELWIETKIGHSHAFVISSSHSPFILFSYLFPFLYSSLTLSLSLSSHSFTYRWWELNRTAYGSDETYSFETLYETNMVRLIRLLAIHVCVVYEITHTQKEVNNNNNSVCTQRMCVCVYTSSLSQTRSPQNNNNTARWYVFEWKANNLTLCRQTCITRVHHSYKRQ